MMNWVILFGGAGREACIERMLAEGIIVQAIIIPKHRSSKLEQSILKFKHLPCELIETEKAALPNILQSFKGMGLFSIGFPYLVPDRTLSLFEVALNIHPTLLPRYRGPASGAYILMNGEKESGSTVHFMTAKMDQGDIVAQSRISLSPFETTRSLQRKVYATEPQLIIDAFLALETEAKNKQQDESEASVYPLKRKPADSEIDPSLSLIELFDEIRACDPDDYPAYFYIHREKVCIKLWRPHKPKDEDDLI